MRANGAGDGVVTDTIVTTNAWDDNGNFISIADSNGHITSYEYDAQDRRVATVLNDGATYTVQYDGASRPVVEIDPRGMRIAKSYDGAGNILTRSASFAETAIRTDVFEYDGLGRMLVAESDDGQGVLISSIENKYDSYGRNDQSRQDGVAVNRSFDDVGRVTGVFHQNGISAVYDRDAIGRIDDVTESSIGLIASIQSAGPSRHASMSFGNGVDLTYDYDDAARVVSKQMNDVGGGTLFGFAIGYDRIGNKLYEGRTDLGEGEVYRYDSYYRLIGASKGVPNPDQHVGEIIPSSFVTHVAYDIDSVHNWLDRTEYTNPADLNQSTTKVFVPNPLNQYAEAGGVSLVYDEAGNLVDDSLRSYVYDDRNLLTEVRDTLNGDFIARYKYDALKRRIAEERADGTITEFVYDGWQVAQEIENGLLSASYIYDDGIDRPIAMIKDGHTYYYHTDSRNNVVMVTDENGAVVERYSYDPYGAVVITDGAGNVIADSTIGNPYRFASRRYDTATGLYYFRNRMYSTDLGRFMQRDPEWYVDGMNLYAYVNDNPVNWWDPWGLSKHPLGVYREPSKSGYYADNPIIYENKKITTGSGLVGILKPNHGLVGTLATGQLMEGSTAIVVYGMDDNPSSWQVSMWLRTEEKDPAVGWNKYGWTRLDENVAHDSEIARETIQYFEGE